MATAQKALVAQAQALRKRIALGEADLDQLKTKLAVIEAKLSGLTPPPQSGLEMLWKIALPPARTRSSKQQCRIEWNKLPKTEKPTIQTMLDALKIWNRCQEWRKDSGAFVPGLHKWIKNRQWENLPQQAPAPSRYPNAPAPLIAPTPQTAASPAEIAEILGTLKSKFLTTPKSSDHGHDH